MYLRSIGPLLGALLLIGQAQAQTSLIGPAHAENTVPPPMLQEVLIKTAILTFNDANLTGNYAVLHARLAKLFRDKITPDGLKQAFKAFSDQKINLGLISAMPPVASTEAKINAARGSLELRGYFDTKPSRVTYELDFLPSEGEWRPALLDVKVRKPGS